MKKSYLIVIVVLFLESYFYAQTALIKSEERYQVIDGFGTCLSGTEARESWWTNIYFEDMECSILRMDLVPRFISPYSDNSYNSPWFHNNPALPGPDSNNVRVYTNATDYTREFAGKQAEIAVMGPDIEENIKLFDWTHDKSVSAGIAAQIGQTKIKELGDFKLIGSIWSPAPWVKISSGNTWNENWYPGPVSGTPWPFIWFDNFAGGKLDVSGNPIEEFNDSAFGGTGATSALTQFARGTAAYIKGFQDRYGVSFYAISIQNEVNFEEFYNSCTYPLSSQYIKALKKVREELDQYEDLKDIKIIGPEDLLGGSAYGMWQYGGNDDPTHKNLQYLKNIALDNEAKNALDFFCIHGYDSDGVTSSGANSQLWYWWVNGWEFSPAAGIPGNIKGFDAYGKKSWMTETSGENKAWIYPETAFPNQGAFSIAMKIHQALVYGRESAWIYWQLTDGKNVSASTLTDSDMKSNSPKYVAAKHFFKHIRPNAVRIQVTSDDSEVWVSSYLHEEDTTLTVVLINTSTASKQVEIVLPSNPSGILSFDLFKSYENQLWIQSEVSVEDNKVIIEMPSYSVATLSGKGNGYSTDIEPENGYLRDKSYLGQNYPNPITEKTIIPFILKNKSFVKLSIHDITGRKVIDLINQEKVAGHHEIECDVSELSAGIYLTVLEIENSTFSRKILIIR